VQPKSQKVYLQLLIPLLHRIFHLKAETMIVMTKIIIFCIIYLQIRNRQKGGQLRGILAICLFQIKYAGSHLLAQFY